ncbi:hypothetical protein PFICI_05105 [Pestalotiopsis fici W106-1]|uniref:non-specific serine/threonine protein kinase n=1 Tax=Pestalotiopsis fici (strain W106-1 / CGMCC3.15140) TaxID=1229662 RepID=W3XB45_PESFW|nr:uncharacterized protein PFICI_05105 [Pestalotiopsis fici W106-1]ETS83229.1 hypothetical protein PFICI_05105 [Pestalotiopsis fici W106-1]
MPRAPDLVHDSKLETTFIAHDTHHVSYKSITSKRQRKVRVDEVWCRKRRIGDGTYGRVWLESCTEGPQAGELRAVKEISKIQANNAETDYTRELEAIMKFSQTKASLRPARHLHFVLFHVLNSRYESSVYIAMEYVEHGDLQKRLTQPYAEIEVQSIASQLLEGLQFMHENGFTHRDLKPSNILVLHPSPDWWVKIGDFGISKRVEEDSTYMRTMIGTIGYLAPEIIGLFPITDDPADQDEKKSYTSAVDIWALGEICFKLITNRPAFSAPRELFNYVTRGYDFPQALLHEANVSKNCVRFIKMAMSPSAANRLSANDGLRCAWMSAEGREEAIGQTRLKEQHEGASSLAYLPTFEATAQWSTLSAVTPLSPMYGAPIADRKGGSRAASPSRMGVDLKKAPPLPSPTELMTNISNVHEKKDKPHISIPDDGTPVTVRTRGHRENRSQTSLLIEYFEGGKSSVRPEGVTTTGHKPSVRVRSTPSKGGRDKNDHIQTTQMSRSARRSSRSKRAHQDPLVPSRSELDIIDSKDTERSHLYAAATEKNSISHHSENDHYQIFETSRPARKSSGSKRAHQDPLVPSRSELDIIDSKDTKSLHLYAAAREPIAPDPKLDDPISPSGDIFKNPKLLESVEDAIRRLILPELESLKREQRQRKMKKLKE